MFSISFNMPMRSLHPFVYHPSKQRSETDHWKWKPLVWPNFSCHSSRFGNGAWKESGGRGSSGRQSAQRDFSVSIGSATPPFLTWKTKSKSKTKKKNKSCLEICIAVSTILLRRGATCITIHSRVYIRPNSIYSISDSLGMSRLWYEWYECALHRDDYIFLKNLYAGPSFWNWVSIFRNNGP